MTTPSKDQASAPRTRRRPPSRLRPESNSSPSTRHRSASEPTHRQQLALPPGVHAVWDGLTVTFDVHYVDSDEDDRVAAAISALLNWLAFRDAAEEGRAA